MILLLLRCSVLSKIILQCFFKINLFDWVSWPKLDISKLVQVHLSILVNTWSENTWLDCYLSVYQLFAVILGITYLASSWLLLLLWLINHGDIFDGFIIGLFNILSVIETCEPVILLVHWTIISLLLSTFVAFFRTYFNRWSFT